MEETTIYPDELDPEFQKKIPDILEFSMLDNVEGLYPHQEFVRRFMAPHTPYTSLMLNHELGSGKSIACISTAMDHFLADGKRCLVVTRGDANSKSFMDQIKKYISMMPSSSGILDTSVSKVFTIVHYTSFCNVISLFDDATVAREYSNKIMIFDEFHNVKRTGADREKSKESYHIYRSIERLITLTKNVKFFVVTATPMTDNIDQLNPILDLLWLKNEKKPINKAFGKISYTSTVIEGPKRVMISENDENGLVVRSFMEGHQLECYLKESTKMVLDIYHSLSQIALFVFDNGSYGGNILSKKVAKVAKIIPSNKDGHAYSRYEIAETHKHCLIGEGLKNSSCKYHRLMTAIIERPGKTFVFIEDVIGSGALLLDCIMREHGYELYNGQNLSRLEMGPRFSLCVGDRTFCPNLTQRLAGFNDPRNKHGEYVKIIIGSKVIGESISMTCVREFHFMSPHWNSSTFRQAEGRVFRSGSHDELEPTERSVNVWIHIASLPPGRFESFALPPDATRAHVPTYDTYFIDMIQEHNSRYISDTIASVDDKKNLISDEKHLKISGLEATIYNAAVDRFVRPIPDDHAIPDSVIKESILMFPSLYMSRIGDVFLDPVVSLFVSNCHNVSGTECKMWFTISEIIMYIEQYFTHYGPVKFAHRDLIVAALAELCASQTDVLGQENTDRPFFLRSLTILSSTTKLLKEDLIYLTSDATVSEHMGRVHTSICGRRFVPGYSEICRGPRPIKEQVCTDTTKASLDNKQSTYEHILQPIKKFVSLDVLTIAYMLEKNISLYLNDKKCDEKFLYATSVLYIADKDTKTSYHIALARFSDSSYAASKISIKDISLVRMFKSGEWGSPDFEDLSIINKIFEDKLEAKRKLLSALHSVYGYVPLHGGAIRLCSALFVGAKKGIARDGDRRLIRRGKSILSFVKEHIIAIYVFLTGENKQVAKYAIEAIDNALVRRSSSKLDDNDVIMSIFCCLMTDVKNEDECFAKLYEYLIVVEEARKHTCHELCRQIVEHITIKNAFFIL